MTPPPSSERWVVVASFIVALMLAAMPMPDLVAAGRPAWVSLVLIYWCIALPERMGIGIGWSLGLLLDVLKGTLLGQHAASYALFAYFALKIHKRLRAFPLTKQTSFVGLMLAMHALLMLWTRGITALPSDLSIYWLPVLSSMLLWPAVFQIMRYIRRKAGVSPSSFELKEGF